MTIVSQLIGDFVFIAAGVMFTGIGIHLASLGVRWLIDSRYDDAKREARREIAARLLADSWWFTEDPVTARLLTKIAEDLITHGWSDVNEVRSRWREWKSGSVNQNRV